MVVSDLTHDVSKNLIKKVNGGFEGTRVKLNPLVTDKIVSCKDLLVDDTVADMVDAYKGKYTAKMFKHKYAYYELLQKIAGHCEIEIDEDFDADDLDDAEYDSDIETAELEDGAVKIKKSKSNKSSTPVKNDYVLTIYDSRINNDAVCGYFLAKKPENIDKILKFVEVYGIDNTIEAIERLIGDATYSSISGNNNYIRVLGLIKFCLNRMSFDEILEILKNYNRDGKAEAFKGHKLFKGFENILAGANGKRIEEYTICAMTDTLVRYFSPDECSSFFDDVRNDRPLFSFLCLSNGTLEILSKNQSFKDDDFIHNVLVTVEKTFDIDDANEQLEKYASADFIKQYKDDKNLLIYQHVFKTSSSAASLKDYYRAITDKRFIEIDGEMPSNDEILSTVKSVQSEEQYKGCTCFVLCWKDFAERTKFANMSYREFLASIVDEHIEYGNEIARYAICQSDSVALGGLTLYRTQKSDAVEVSLWVFPEFGHIKVAKEAIYTLVKSLKDNYKVRDLVFRVHKDNRNMRNILEDFGAETDNFFNSEEYIMYSLNVYEASSKKFDEVVNRRVLV